MREPPPNHRTHMFRHGKWVKRHIPDDPPLVEEYDIRYDERPVRRESLYDQTTRQSNSISFYGLLILFAVLAIVGIIGYYTGAF